MCTSDESLMESYVLADDAAAFAELFRRYAPVLSGFFARRGKRSSDAQDLVQETFLHLHRARYDFRQGEAFRPWLFTIARNLSHDHGRRMLRKPEHYADLDLQQASQPEPVAVMLHAERTRSLEDALVRLPRAERHLLEEHFWQERSFIEIGARDGVHSTTLRVRAHRTCAKLRAWISELQP